MQGAALLCKILDLIPDEALHVNFFIYIILLMSPMTHVFCDLYSDEIFNFFQFINIFHAKCPSKPVYESMSKPL